MKKKMMISRNCDDKMFCESIVFIFFHLKQILIVDVNVLVVVVVMKNGFRTQGI